MRRPGTKPTRRQLALEGAREMCEREGLDFEELVRSGRQVKAPKPETKPAPKGDAA